MKGGIAVITPVFIFATVFLAAAGFGSEKCEGIDIRSSPTLEEAAEASYDGIYEERAKLTGGRYDGEPFVEGGASRPTVQLVRELYCTGDLGDDGRDETVVLLAENSGGSGSYLYIAALVFGRDGIGNVGTSPVGDRIQIRSMIVDGGEVVLGVVQHGPEDPMCCPTRKATRRWKLDDEGLVEMEQELGGAISLVDLEGIVWVLREFSGGRPSPEDPEINLVFDNGGISGFSGCNTYFAKIHEPSPTEINIGPIGRTKKGCQREIMELEDRYLGMLGSAFKYGFLAGRLVLTTKDDSGLADMTFEPVGQDSTAGQ